MRCHRYTDEEKEFLREFVDGHSHAEIRDAFENKFGWNITIGQVRSSIKRYGLKTGRTGYFQKGRVPHNKGKKMTEEVYEKAKHTMFKKGQLPQNYRPVGSERINVDGYKEIKVEDPRKWKLKHVFVWEQHNGKVPKGHVVIFLDGNTLNTDISNLALISRNELLTLNRNNLHGKSQEITKTGINLARLINKTNEIKKREKKC